ncbi:MAG: gephyrin-like molybdotransferase Glp [Armatimonadota bacterium]
MLTVEQAQSAALESVSALPSERLPFLQALGRVLAEPISATTPLPPFDNSAMDGFAVIAADTAGATPATPRALKLVGDIPAGAVLHGRVGPGTAARIMTGAPLPEGADAVVMVERTRPGAAGTIEILAPAQPGDNVRRMGEDIGAGETALDAGQLLGPGELGVAAALGCTHVIAVRRPRVAIVTTGSELTNPGDRLKPGAIYNSNQTAIAACVLRSGCEVAVALHVDDDEVALEGALQICANADAIVTVGGVSVGDYDYVKAVLARLGDIKFWRLLMKPGRPFAFGTLFGLPLFGLPGNPISALVTFEVLVAPALRKMAGRRDRLPLTTEARLLSDLRHKPGRREYCQAVTRWTEGGLVVEPSPKQGSAMLNSVVGSNSLVVIPEISGGLRAGERVTVVLLGHGSDEL